MNITGYMVDSIGVKEPNGISNYGDPTYGSLQTISARVEETTKIVRNAVGEEHQATHRIFTEELIDLNSLVWLPGEDTDNDDLARRPLRIHTSKVKNGSYQFYVTYVGK